MQIKMQRAVGFAVFAAMLGGAGTSLAQRSVDQTGTGGGPASTITAPNTLSNGVTRPPGDGGAAVSADTPVDRRVRRQDRKIERGICRGC